MKNPFLASCFVACFGLVATSTSAQVLMLDFGPTAATDGNLTNSPYHTENSGFTDTKWNTIGTGDPTSLAFSDNNLAGATVKLGATNTTSVNLDATQPASSNALGIATKSGVYAGNSVGTDGIFSGSASNNTVVGLQIGGLIAGTYDIYVVARNTNTGAEANKGYSQTVFVGTSATDGSFNFAGYSSETLTYPDNSSTSLYTDAWVEGQNYVKLSITLSAGEFIHLAVDGTALGTSGDTRGFLNAVQIVNTSAIPEPASYSALGGLAALGVVGLRRRR